MIERIALVTDFATGSPYLGQMKLYLSGLLPRIPVIELVSDLVPFRPDLAAYLLPALARDMPVRTLYICVVDPGVGGDRGVLAVEADGDWYVGPDNGLLALVVRRAKQVEILQVNWRPEHLSDSFHGRDLFCPLAAKLSKRGAFNSVRVSRNSVSGSDWPDELPNVIYVDRYGNLITGLRASGLDKAVRLRVSGREIFYARTFCEAPLGKLFWYEDSFGLVELSVNQGDADRTLGIGPGEQIELLKP